MLKPGKWLRQMLHSRNELGLYGGKIQKHFSGDYATGAS